MERKALHRIAPWVSRFFRPVVRPFSWWQPFRLGTVDIVVLADSTAIFMVAMGGLYAGYLSWTYLLFYCFLLSLLPFIFLTIVVIKGKDIKVWRLVCFIPYWMHRVPVGSRFDLYEAWQDAAPSGVAFESYAADPLPLGTAMSAEPLFRHLGPVLEKVGWKRTTSGWEMPQAD